MTSRRQFFHFAGLLPFAAGSVPATGLAAGATGLERAAVEAELRRRADHYLKERRLVVDYYRIRRRLAYPLPLRSLLLPSIPVPTISDYPWGVWMLWALEERVNTLGWTAEWSHSPDVVRAASLDLEAFSEWPSYKVYKQPDLPAGHSGRLLWAACTKWRWLDTSLRDKLRAACGRHVEEVAPASASHYGQIGSKSELLSSPDFYRKLHNIPLIGTLGAALAAAAAAHPARKALNERIGTLFGAILDARTKGFTEAVGYDGYVLDFIADWLGTLAPDERAEFLNHPCLKHDLDESYMLSAPGAMEQVAELSDVEPREMPFHYSAQAKLAGLQSDPARAWYLGRWPLEWIRADALGALRPLAGRLSGAAPKPGLLDAHYARVLRTGWERDDVAVAVSCTTSPMGHLHLDTGTLVIGSRGHWVITDPGYQQYMDDIEREFTIGPAAHNCPLVNGLAQDKKAPRVVTSGPETPGALSTALELAACYPTKANVKSLVRRVWLAGRDCVVVADRIGGGNVQKLSYHWHAHREASLWAGDGSVLVHLPDVDVSLVSPQVPLSGANIRRLPGSRGQLTVVTDVSPVPPVVWWVFSLSVSAPRVNTLDGGRAIELMGRRFEVS